MNDKLLRLAQSCATGYGFEALNIKPLSGGRINDGYRVQTSKGESVLRLYPSGRAKKQVLFEMSLMEHLHKNSCRIPAPLKQSNGSSVGKHEGRITVWLEFLNAAPLTGNEAYAIQPEALAKLLHPVFQSLETFPPPFSGTAETHVFQRRLPSLLSALIASGDSTLATALQDLFDDLKQWEASLQLPTSAVHADIHPGNVLLSQDDGDLWLIDFDDGHVGFRAADWVLPALEFAFDTSGAIDEARYDQLLEALVPRRATPEERDALPRFRTLLTLKFAVALADLGDPLGENRYLRLLRSREVLL